MNHTSIKYLVKSNIVDNIGNIGNIDTYTYSIIPYDLWMYLVWDSLTTSVCNSSKNNTFDSISISLDKLKDLNGA